MALPPLLPSPSRSTPPPLKRLSPDEIASRWECGLYFNCDKKFHKCHRFASRVFLLIVEEDESHAPHIVMNDPPPDPPNHVDPIDPCPTPISFNSLAGHLAPETLRLLGRIANH